MALPARGPCAALTVSGVNDAFDVRQPSLKMRPPPAQRLAADSRVSASRCNRSRISRMVASAASTARRAGLSPDRRSAHRPAGASARGEVASRGRLGAGPPPDRGGELESRCGVHKSGARGCAAGCGTRTARTAQARLCGTRHARPTRSRRERRRNGNTAALRWLATFHARRFCTNSW